MADTVSSLSINFGANTAGLKMGVADVQGTLNKLGSSAGGIGSKISGGFGLATGATSKLGSSLAGLAAAFNPVAIAAAAAAAGVYALSAGVGSAMENIDALAKLGDTAGIDFETFQGFAHAADLAGSSGEALGSALQKMQRNLVDARDDTGATADALRTLGLDSQAVAAMSSEDAFRAIADAVQAIEDPALRVSAAMDIFGRSGGDLVPLLSGGSAALKESEELINKYGLALSRVDAQKIEDANDQWGDFLTVAQGIANHLAVALAPAFEDFAKAMEEMAGEWVSLIKDAAPLITELASRFVGLVTDFIALTAPFREFAVAIVQDLNDIAEATGVVSSSAKFEKWAQPIKAAGDATDSFAKSLSKATADAAKELEKLMKRGESLTQSLRLPDEIYADTITELKQLAAAGAITEETFGRAFRKAAEELDKSAMKAQQAFQPLNVGAVTRNSMAGFSAVIDGDNAQKKMAENTQKMVEELRRQTAIEREALNAYRSTQRLNVITSI